VVKDNANFNDNYGLEEIIWGFLFFVRVSADWRSSDYSMFLSGKR
jgi:hypothetical protein